MVVAASLPFAGSQPRAASPQAATERFRSPDVLLPPSAEHAYQALKDRVDGRAAFAVVHAMSPYWRLAGNPGFNASIDFIHRGLINAGFAAASAGGRPWVKVEEYHDDAPGWDYRKGTVAFADSDEVVLSKERDRVSLCINSYSTPAGGVEARLVDVGAGNAGDFDKVDVRGAIVLGDAAVGRLWQQAVRQRGAIGVISTSIAPYIRPDDAAAFERPEQRDVLQWGGVPNEPERRAFGFKASWRAASRLRERLRAGDVRLRVEIASTFYPGPARMLIAEFPGTSHPDQRIVMVAHVQEPGANDNASGCGTLYALALALADAMKRGALPRPARTLTLMWGDEVRGSRHWLSAHADQARGTQYMFALDMTGEDTSKTGGTFLIEKQPDPSAVWVRPSDSHTAWGASPVKAESLKGSLLNDLHLAVCLRRAKDTGWVVRTNPYEGGSDHTAFGTAGVPALLDWHFTDRYYHTNQDTEEKTSRGEMVNVATAVGTTAWTLASANDGDGEAVVQLLSASAASRLALERRQGAAIVAAASDRNGATAVEAQVMAAWTKWYREALESVRALPAGGASPSLNEHVAAAQQAVGR